MLSYKYNAGLGVVMKKTIFIVLVLSLLFTLSTCYFTGDSTVSISQVIKAIGLPTDITSVELTVSGPGMNTIVVVYDSLPSTIELSIPSGSDRTFELVVYVDTPIIAATSYEGITTVDLSQGNAEITLTMGVGSTKLIIPDYWNNRIVQIDNISGSGWIHSTGLSIGYGADNQFDPYDIDFDAQGRIYIANNDNTLGGVIRIDTINDILYDPIVSLGSVITIAIDRTNSFLYYATTSQLYKYDLEDSINNPIGMDTINSIRGITVNEDGILYVAGMDNIFFQDSVFRYDPVSQVVTATNSNASLNEPWDVLVKEDRLYVTNFNPGGSLKILSLDHNLSSDEWYGDSPPPEDPGYFYGPRRFIAVLNRKIHILDEGFSGNRESILAMDNIGPWDNWDVFNAEDIGETKFALYSTC